LGSLVDYESFSDTFDVIPLIKAIKGLTYQFERQWCHSQALHKAVRRSYKFYQTKDMFNAMSLENFQILISVVKDYGGEIGFDPSRAKKELVAEGIYLLLEKTKTPQSHLEVRTY
jgi:hypothetical protein